MFPELDRFWEIVLIAAAKRQTAGRVPGRRAEIAVENYASTIATISCVRGSMITICSPTRMYS